MSVNIFDSIVIGKGLIGAAAAKYLSVANKKNIALIGPDETTNDENALVYSSHYDAARVQRIIGKDEVWTELNKLSVNAYESIENEGGIKFHHKVGCLYVNPVGQDDYLKSATHQAQKINSNSRFYTDGALINKNFSCFNFPNQSCGLYEQALCGYIQPRNLVQAQLNIFKKNGGSIYLDTVTKVELKNNVYHVSTNEGNLFFAKNVLVTTGSFINCFNILPTALNLSTKSETIILVKVDEQEAISLQHMPSLLYEIQTDKLDGIYLIQPVKYPDGNYYLKVGCNFNTDIYFKNLQQIQQWFKHGDSDENIDALVEVLKNLLPTISFAEVISKRCIISRTTHGRPYIGETNLPNMFVAGGCNGYSAMCSDGIGKVTAHLMQNRSLPSLFAHDSFIIEYM